MQNRYGTGRSVRRRKMRYILEGTCNFEAEVWAGSREEAEDYFNDHFKSVLECFPEIAVDCRGIREVWV